MADQNRWSEDRSRENSRYGLDADAYRDRDNLQRDRQDFGGRSDDRYGGGFGGQGRAFDTQGARAGGYGTDAYGVPSDYSYRGPRASSYGQGDGQSYSQAGNYDAGRYGQGQFGQGLSGQTYGDGRYADNRQDYGRSFGADRYPLGGGRPQEDRSFWSQTRDEVSSWFGDDEARRRREQDELRAGEHRGRGPKGYTRSDDRIRDDVSDLLTDNARLDASDIEVAVSGAEVTLTGTVNQRGDKRLAEDLADSISGVKHVQNNLRLKDAGAGLATRIPVGATSAAGASAAGSTTAQTGAGVQARAN